MLDMTQLANPVFTPRQRCKRISLFTLKKKSHWCAISRAFSAQIRASNAADQGEAICCISRRAATIPQALQYLRVQIAASTAQGLLAPLVQFKV
jgi:hypothetical protein